MFLYPAMPGIKKHQLLSILLLVVLWVNNSFAADTEELGLRLERLQKSPQNTAPLESKESLDNQLQLLKELLGKEYLSQKERERLEERLKALKGRLPTRKKPFISMEETALEPTAKRFFIEGRYWLLFIEDSNKQVALYYDIATQQPLGGALNTSVSPAGAFVISAGYNHSSSRTSLLKFWHLDTSGSLNRTATTTVGISATEASNYYFQNNKWTTTPLATKGVDKVAADSRLKVTNLDMLHTVSVGKGGDKEVGIALGLKYAQLDSNHSINYSSATSTLYNIKSDVENTLLGPLFGIYGKGPLFNKLRVTGMMDIAVTWDHVRAGRFEYDNTVPQTALNIPDNRDIAVPVIDAEVGVRYPIGQSFFIGLDYKAAYFSSIPFELKSPESTLLNTPELQRRNLLFHGLTAGITYSF